MDGGLAAAVNGWGVRAIYSEQQRTVRGPWSAPQRLDLVSRKPAFLVDQPSASATVVRLKPPAAGLLLTSAGVPQ